MKRLGASILLLAATAPLAATEASAGPTVDEVLTAYAAAHGGRERWQALDSLVLEGTQEAFSEPAPFRLTLAPGRMRLDHGMLKGDVTFAWDGSAAWWLFPFFGYPWATRTPAAEARWFERDAGTDLPLLAWRDGGATVELAGETEHEGAPAWEVRVVFGDDDEETWYLDRQTHLEQARRFTGADFGVPGEWWEYYSDFRTVDGLVLAHRYELEGQTRYVERQVESVQVDAPLEAGFFALPAGPEISGLLALAGEWQLAIETRPSPRAPWSPPETTTATFAPIAGDVAVAQTLTADRNGIPTAELRNWSFDRSRSSYRVAAIDQLSGLLEVFEGAAGEQGLTLRNRATAGDQPGQSHQQWQILEIGPERLVIEIEISQDGGETWQALVRETYTRAQQP